MPGCVLHVVGKDFDVDAFLTESDLCPYHVYRRGEIRRRDETFSYSGLKFNVSDADGGLAEEAADAIRFLLAHELELRKLYGFPGVGDLRLDFGYYRREVAVQCDFLPPELLARAGNLGIGIELSPYPTPLPEIDVV